MLGEDDTGDSSFDGMINAEAERELARQEYEQMYKQQCERWYYGREFPEPYYIRVGVEPLTGEPKKIVFRVYHGEVLIRTLSDQQEATVFCIDKNFNQVSK